MRSTRAFRIRNEQHGQAAGVETLSVPENQAGSVLLRVRYSSVNYKDALAGAGRAKILRRFPLTGGIDASGEVVESGHPNFQPGDAALITGWGLSCDHDGGFADFLQVPGDWLTPLPHGLDSAQCMILGTAGFTAALAVHQMLLNGQEPAMGPIIVTGATGGVGSIAIAILTQLGFDVVAVSRKSNLRSWLTTLGASEILAPDQLPGGERPLEKAVWGGAIDNFGGQLLALLTRTLMPNGCIACIGQAGGNELNTTVMPFILRGIKLLGCNSVDVAPRLRDELWHQLAQDWRPRLDQIHTKTIGLEDLPKTFEAMLGGQTHGRILVDLAIGQSPERANS